MQPTELAETNNPAIDPDADPEGLYIAIQRIGHQAMLVATAAMHFARCLGCACGMVGLTDGKIEGRHNRIADRLVKQAIIFPNSGRTLVVEDVKEGGNSVLPARIGTALYNLANPRTTR